MTGPIRPPSKPPEAMPPIAAPTSRPEADGAAAFRDARVTTPELPTHRIASMAMQDVRLADVVSELRAGRIGVDQVVDAVIDRALTSGAATTLSSPAREHLATTLRRQLAEDPAIATLVADLGKAR